MLAPLPCLAALAGLIALPAFAQSIGEPLPRTRDPLAAPARKPAPHQQAARPCPEYGAGFVRVEGTTTCVRVGGAVRAEFGTSSRRYRGSRYGSSAAGMVQLESRTQTGLGPIRSVIQVQGRVDRGLESGPFR